MWSDKINIECLLNEMNIPKKTKAGDDLSLFGRVSLLAERANKACSGRACLCGTNSPVGQDHFAFCPAYEEPARG